MREYKEIYNYKQYKSTHELQNENSRNEQGAWKDRALDSLPMIHASVAHLLLKTGRIHELQTTRSGHVDTGGSETP